MKAPNKIKSYLSLAFVIVIAGILFGAYDRFTKISGRQDHWDSRWSDHGSISADLRFDGMEHATAVPAHIDQDFTLSASGSPWLIDSTVTIDAGVTLTIEPGVELVMAPMADIKVFGRILAHAKAEEPIVVRANSQDLEAAWGGMYIQSEDLSEFTHVSFENGRLLMQLAYSAAKLDRCSVKNVREIFEGYYSDLICDACVFDSGAYVGTGNINFFKFNRGQGQIENSIFYCPDVALQDGGSAEGAKVDCIDADHVTRAIIRGNSFFGGGQCENSDGIDLGAGSHNILIENNLIYRFVDKGVSVGDDVEVTLHNNFIVKCAIGVGVKNRGSALISNTTFYGNQTAVNCYAEIVGQGGHVEVNNSVIAASGVNPVLVDDVSSLRVTNTFCDDRVLVGSGNAQGTPEFEDSANYNFNLKLNASESVGIGALAYSTWGANLKVMVVAVRN